MRNALFLLLLSSAITIFAPGTPPQSPRPNRHDRRPKAPLPGKLGKRGPKMTPRPPAEPPPPLSHRLPTADELGLPDTSHTMFHKDGSRTYRAPMSERMPDITRTALSASDVVGRWKAPDHTSPASPRTYTLPESERMPGTMHTALRASDVVGRWEAPSHRPTRSPRIMKHADGRVTYAIPRPERTARAADFSSTSAESDAPASSRRAEPRSKLPGASAPRVYRRPVAPPAPPRPTDYSPEGIILHRGSPTA